MTTSTTNVDRIADDLMTVFYRLFDGVLLNASQSVDSWNHRLHTFERINLLEFATPSSFKPKPIEFDESRLDEPGYRRALVRKLKAPRPSKWVRHKLEIQRDKIDDSSYRDKMAKVLTYKWVHLLGPVEAIHDVLPLFRASVKDLEYILDQARLNLVDALWCSSLLVRSMAYRLIDENPKYQELERTMRQAGKEARDSLAQALDSIGRQVILEANVGFSAIVKDATIKSDLAIDGIRERLRAVAESAQAALDEHGIDPNEDREESFRQAVKRREAEMKRQRIADWRRKPLWVRSLPYLGGAIVTSVLVFAVEVNGTTLAQWLSNVFA